MASEIDPDVYRSASHRNAVEHLTGTLQTGATDSALPLVGGNRVVLTGSVREPLLLVAPKASLDETGIRVKPKLDPDGAATALPLLEFVPYTESGAFLVLYRPKLDPVTRTADGFTIELALEFFDRDGAAVAVADPSPSAHLEVRLLQGTLGALAYVMTAEKQRVRRQGRELTAMRILTNARGDALDRFGADLAVPRFSDRIQFDAPKKEIITVHKDGAGALIRESDPDYLRRLRLYMPWLVPTPPAILRLLNGVGAPSDPNTGPIGELGLQQRFTLVQQNNELAFSVFVTATAQNILDNLIEFIRNAFLIWPAASPAANAAHAGRPMPTLLRARTEQLRVQLQNGFDFGATMAIAPQLADYLARVARCRAALGQAGKITIKRAQDTAAGSRYQLGVGADIEPPLAAELDAMHTALTDPNRAPAGDAALEALLRGMQSRPAAEDPEGAWLFQACGIRTVHRVNANTIYLSHLPTFGLVVERAQPPDARGAGPFRALYHAPGDPGSNVVLVAAVASASTAWAAQGGEAFDVLADAAARTEWDQPVAVPQAALTILKAAGLPAVADNASVVPQLKNLPEELVQTIRLGPNMSQQILAGTQAVAAPLATLAGLLRSAGVVSVLPLVVTGNRVQLVLGVTGLPEAGINLADRRATGFRWYVVPIEGPGGTVKTIGSRTVYAPKGPGVNAIVSIGYARRGLADPYEFRVELPGQARLNLVQYEYLMNLLERVYPIGIEVNTFSIRQRHVDLDQDGDAEPLPPSVSRTYRRFQRPRQRGESAVGLDSKPEGA